MSEQQDKSALPIGTVVRGYRLLDVLGIGGFGVTYMAEDSESGERVAVKEYLPIQFAVRDGATVHPKSDASRENFEWGLDRFLSEAGMLTRFRHPNIVKVEGYFKANNTAYIVMEYEEGEPLDKLLDRRGKLTEAQLKRVLLPIADGLRQVHARGVWHRDVKPANIFVRRSNESPVLLDFGAARNALGARSASMTAIVSPPYAPPEQYDSRGELGAYTDVYALSALCWRAITGELPEESPYRQRLASKGRDPLPSLAETQPPGYSDALLRAVDWGLRLDEEERPQSVAEWLDAMGEGQEQAAPPDPSPAQAMPPEPDPNPPARPDSPEPDRIEPEVEESAREGMFRKLVRGRYGLANTYWRFGVFGGVAYGVAATVATLTGVEAISWALFAVFAAYWLAVAVGVWRAAGMYAGWKVWPVLARLAMLLGAGLLAVSLFNAVRDAMDWDGLLDVSEDVGDTEAAPPTERVPSFTLANRSSVEIAVVRAKPSARPGWGDNKVAAAPIPAGESRAVSLLSYGYGDQCRFDVRIEVGAEAQAEAHDVFEKDLCANNVVVFGRDGAFATWVERAPFTIETVPADARVRVLNIAPAYREGMELPPGSYRVEVSAEGYETATESVPHGAEPTVRGIALREADPKAGDRFRDCPECPEMVVVPAGSYRMGSPSGELGRTEDEGPVHRVTIGAPFAVGRHEVTFGQWDACAGDGGCPRGGDIADDEGWGRGQRPVINVSWDDAQRYVQWLSRKTSKQYRLLSESEWEYVARAGTDTAYSWGDEIGAGRANCDGCGSEWDAKRTAPVGSFEANAWGLHDTHGNVYEWVEDCWNGGYAGSPGDGSAWLGGICSYRVLRGGSWNSTPGRLRSANRNWGITGIRRPIVGFRVVRTLTP